MGNLVVLNNEKISEKNNKFYCRNFNFKILPEGLNKFFNVQYIARKSKTDEHHELNLQNIRIASNIIQFIYYVLSTFKNKDFSSGEVAEWLKAHAWKACKRETVSRVRIPLSPPLSTYN